MTALLSPRVWICLALAGVLAFSHGFIYKAGRAAVRSAWDKERAEQVALALAESESRRMKEKALNFTNEGITNAHTKEKARLASAGRAAADRLREFEAAGGRAAIDDTSAIAGADDPHPAIANQCAAALVRLDEYAQGVASQARGLQAYASNVCLIR